MHWFYATKQKHFHSVNWFFLNQDLFQSFPPCFDVAYVRYMFCNLSKKRSLHLKSKTLSSLLFNSLTPVDSNRRINLHDIKLRNCGFHFDRKWFLWHVTKDMSLLQPSHIRILGMKSVIISQKNKRKILWRYHTLSSKIFYANIMQWQQIV